MEALGDNTLGAFSFAPRLTSQGTPSDMATWTIATQKAKLDNASNPATTRTTPVAIGLTFDDSNATTWPGIRHFLNELQMADHRGFSFVATSDGGTTYVQAGDRGGQGL